jgi:uncharacterized protein YceK
MGRAVTGLLLAACAAGLCGCGTSNNLNDPNNKPAIYGGVRRDLDMQIVADFYLNSASTPPSFLSTVPLVLLSIADLPFSAVCDTLSLPITIRAAIQKDLPPGDKPKPTPPGPAASAAAPATAKQ